MNTEQSLAIHALYQIKRHAIPTEKAIRRIEELRRNFKISEDESRKMDRFVENTRLTNSTKLASILNKIKVFLIPQTLLVGAMAHIVNSDAPVEDFDSTDFEDHMHPKPNELPLLPFDSVFYFCADIALVAMNSISKGKTEFNAPIGFIVTKTDAWCVFYMVRHDAFGAIPMIVESSLFMGIHSEEAQKSMLNHYLSMLNLLYTMREIGQAERLPPSLKASMAIKKAAKATGQKVMPNEYYLIDADKYESAYLDAALDTARSGVQNYCYDVMGWQSYRFIRGLLPIDESYEKRLRKDAARTIIKSSEDITPDIQRVLDNRGITYQEGHWLSVRPYSVPSHQRNKDKPYVPAIRVIQ